MNVEPIGRDGRVFAYVMRDLEVYEERMLANLNASGGLVFSGRALLALVESGMRRNDAYEIIQAHAMAVWQGEGDLMGRLAADPRVRERLDEAALEAIFDLEQHLRQIEVPFARLGLG